MKKECQFILLPADKASGDVLLKNNSTLTYGKYCPTGLYKPQHLYILSDEEIKEGDKCYDKVYNRIVIAKSIKENFVSIVPNLVGLKHSNISNLKKIIATTDPELKLPSISQSDVEYIISIYNGKNKEVDVEKLAEDSLGKDECFSELKESFVIGYNQCLEDNADKKFTLEDMRKVFNEGMLLPNSQIESSNNIFQQVIKSLTNYIMIDKT